jgi:hypothetical protein
MTAKSGRKNEYPTASAIVILNEAQKQRFLELASKDENAVLDILVLPCDTEVTIKFVVNGKPALLKPIYFKTSSACEKPK